MVLWRAHGRKISIENAQEKAGIARAVMIGDRLGGGNAPAL